jgi:hypothetical protein
LSLLVQVQRSRRCGMDTWVRGYMKTTIMIIIIVIVIKLHVSSPETR